MTTTGMALTWTMVSLPQLRSRIVPTPTRATSTTATATLTPPRRARARDERIGTGHPGVDERCQLLQMEISPGSQCHGRAAPVQVESNCSCSHGPVGRHLVREAARRWTGRRPVATKSCETASEKFSWQFDRSPQEAQVMVPGNFNAAKLLQVRGEPLRVE